MKVLREFRSKAKDMKVWDCQVKSESEMTRQLMFREIMQLRQEAVDMYCHFDDLLRAVEQSDDLDIHVQEVAEKCRSFKTQLDGVSTTSK